MIKDYQVQERAHLPLVPTKYGTLWSGLGVRTEGRGVQGKERGARMKKNKKFKKTNNIKDY